MELAEGINKLSKALRMKSFSPSLESLLEEDQRVVIFSDSHLGWRRSKKKDFDKFLDYLKDDAENENLNVVVANGDILEFWRRDNFKVLVENLKSLAKLWEIGEKCRVYWVVGNHDYTLKEFYSPRKKDGINFPRELVLKLRKGRRYRFVHGDQYDPTEVELFFTPLCKGTDDITGELIYEIGGRFLSSIRSMLERPLKTALQTYLSIELRKRRNEMLKAPEERKVEKVRITSIVEENACDDVRENEFLIFSHTHKAFTDPRRRIANPGSWVKGSFSENTYLSIKGERVKLEEF